MLCVSFYIFLSSLSCTAFEMISLGGSSLNDEPMKQAPVRQTIEDPHRHETR